MSALPSHIGAYEVVRLLGKGGMAIVYLGRDPAIDRLVAIKLLRESLDSVELRERFSREAKSAGRLRHPNIVTVFQVGVHDNAPFIVMEYIPGESLADVIKRQPPVSLTWKLRVIEDLCRGLAYAHKSGVVHRDMKPANIQIDSDGGVKILDFGIARLGEQKAGEEALTRLGMMMGTPNYMAPEQINPGTADHRSDVFAVGLVFYELLTYHRAFGGDSYAVLHNILNQEPDPVERHCPGIDPEIIAIVNRSLAKNPDARYQDLGDMRDDIRRIRLRLRAASDDMSDEGPVAAGPHVDSDLDVTRLADRRTEVTRFLDEARAAYDANDFQKALELSQQALKLDGTFTAALELATRASDQITLARARDLIAAGQEAYAAGSLDTAAIHIREAEALQLPGAGGTTVQAQLSALARAVASAIERQKALRQRLDRARELLTNGELDDAAHAVEEALGLSPGNRDALALRTEVRAAIDAARARQRAAEDAVAEARLQAQAGRFDSAVALLQQHQPQHPLVTAALVEIQALKAEAERRAADERRRQEHAAAARAILNAAREAAEQGDLAGALRQIESIAFADPGLASPALDRVKVEADALTARCEAGQHLQAARAALAANDLTVATTSLDQARHRDPNHPDNAGVATAIDRARAIRDRLTRARADLQRGELESADRLVGEALTQTPDHAEALQLRESVRSAMAEREATQQRAADEAIAHARREAGRGNFSKAIAHLKQHRPTHPQVTAALTEIIDQQAAAERRAADERRRQEHASRAGAAIRAARAAADQGDQSAALMLLQGIEFEGPEISSPALDALKAEAEALIARCEAAGYLDMARAELAKGNRDAAVEAVELARQRDASHPDLDEVSAAASSQTVPADSAPASDSAVPAEATVYLPRPANTPPHGVAAPPADQSADAFPPTLVQPGEMAADRTVVLRPSPVSTPAPAAPPPPAVPAPSAAPPAAKTTPGPAAAAPARTATAPSVQADKKSSIGMPVIIGAAAAAVIVIAAIWWAVSKPASEPATTIAQNTTATALPAPTTTAPTPATASPETPAATPSATPPPAAVPNGAPRGNPQPAPATASPAVTRAPATPPPGRGSATPPPPAPATTPQGRGAAGRAGGTSAAPAPAGPSVAPTPASGNQPAPPAITTPPTATPAPVVREPASVPPAPVPRAPEPAVERPSAPPAPDPARDEAAIRSVLAQYAAGYQRLDPAAIRAVWPSAPADLQKSFSDLRSYAVQLQDPQVTVRGDTATVSTVRRIRQQPKAGRTQEVSVQSTFTLRRTGASWVIDSIR